MAAHSDESRQFQRRTEDFDCLVCGRRVLGDGYTNHCPCCLFSLHVDNNPGDRQADCQGLMQPIAAKREGRRGLMILHRCSKCAHERWNRVAEGDDMDLVTDLLATS